MIERDWYNCHSGGWKGEITDEAFAHPAKFARGLIRRIYEHCLEQGYLKPGDTVLDPFGGVALGGCDAIPLGLNWLGFELEEKFVALGNQNIDLWHQRAKQAASWGLNNWGTATLLQGDSRYLAQVLRKAGGVVSIDKNSLQTYNGGKTEVVNNGEVATSQRTMEDVSSGSIIESDCGTIQCSLDIGSEEIETSGVQTSESIGGAQTSLPGGETRTDGGQRLRSLGLEGGQGSPEVQRQSTKERMRRVWVSAEPLHSSQGFRPLQQPPRQSPSALCELPHEPTQKGSLGRGKERGDTAEIEWSGGVGSVITSPPYARSNPEANSKGIDVEKQWRTYRSQGGGMSLEGFRQLQEKHSQGYGSGYTNLANLPEGNHAAVVSSPPYEGIMNDKREGGERRIELAEKAGYDRKYLEQKYGYGQTCYAQDYGISDGQLGTEAGDDFWSAARLIMQQVAMLLPPDAVSVWVCKRFVKDKKIVQFSRQWAVLGEACGFETIEWIRAWLIEDRGAQYNLFGGLEERQVARKSFFRRLYESKYPENSIDWEDVIIQRRAAVI